MPADNQALMAPNQLIQAPDGVTYAYRRFGDAAAGSLPLVLLQHFRGNLDDWDPLLLDTLAAGRQVTVWPSHGRRRRPATSASAASVGLGAP